MNALILKPPPSHHTAMKLYKNALILKPASKLGLLASRGVEPLIAYVVQVQNYVFVNLREEMKLRGHTLSKNVVRRGEGSKRFKMCGYP